MMYNTRTVMPAKLHAEASHLVGIKSNPKTRGRRPAMHIVRNLMEMKKVQGVISVPPTALVLDALRAFAEHKISSVVVMDGGIPVGIYTKTDYALKGEIAGRSALAPIKDVMSTNVKVIRPEADMFDCAEVMYEDKVTHLVVVDGPELREEVVGVVSVKDILAALVVDFGRVRSDRFGADLTRT